MYKLAGTIKVVNPTVQVSEKFSKREFVVSDTSGMYPQDILFQLKDTFDVGEPFDFKIAFKNISDVNFDSLKSIPSPYSVKFEAA